MNAKSYLVQDLKRAQAETITQGCRGVFKISSDGKSYTFGCDYLAYDVSASPSADKIFFVRYLPEKISITSDAPVILNSRGQTIDLTFIITSVNLTLWEAVAGSPEQFATGVLTGTGVFEYS